MSRRPPSSENPIRTICSIPRFPGLRQSGTRLVRRHCRLAAVNLWRTHCCGMKKHLNGLAMNRFSDPAEPVYILIATTRRNRRFFCATMANLNCITWGSGQRRPTVPIRSGTLHLSMGRSFRKLVSAASCSMRTFRESHPRTTTSHFYEVSFGRPASKATW